MSRKLFKHFVKSKYIDIYREIKTEAHKELCSDWWVKHQERERKYKQKKQAK